jgi:GDP-L-fucose synthase
MNLIIGADGFIGRHLSAYLQARGQPVYLIGRAAGDLSNRDNVERAFRAAPAADRIFHLATRQRTGQAQFGIQGELLAINARLHLNVLDAWRQFQPRAKLISTGSSCVFPELDRAIIESDFQSGPMHDSVRGYGLAKQLLAVGCETYGSQYGLNYLHLILATVYGPGDHKVVDRAHFAGGMIDRAVHEMRAGEKKFTVWGDPGTVRDLLYVEDQIEAILAADRAFNNCILNCNSNLPVTIGDVAKAVVATLRWNTEIVYPPGTFKGASYKTLDASRFLKATGWQPRISLTAGIQEILRADYGIDAAG